MPKPRTESGEKNLISKRLAKLRQEHHMSQRDLANKLQAGRLRHGQKRHHPASRPTNAMSPIWN